MNESVVSNKKTIAYICRRTTKISVNGSSVICRFLVKLTISGNSKMTDTWNEKNAKVPIYTQVQI